MTHQSETLNTILPDRKDGTISSVIVLPEKLEFETQNPNERVYIMLRRHSITNLGWIITGILSAIAPFFVLIGFSYFNVDLAQFGVKAGYIAVAVLLWYLLIFSTNFMKFLDWYFNMYVITNERILDFDFNPFAYHKISEAGLENIEDATQETIGFFPMLFNYGDVYIQTAAERREFDFHAVPNPSWLRDKIMDLRDLIVKNPV